MAKPRTRRVVFQPVVHRRVQRGIDLIVDAIRPTLGPLPRFVAIERTPNSRAPELLDSGGVIARRIIQLPNRDEDMGAMFVRHLLWRLQERVGDGTATAATLLQAIYREGVRHVAAGGSPMRLRHHLERGMALILNSLDAMTLQEEEELEGKARLAQIAESICHDAELAGMLGEVFDIIGPHGQLDIRTGRSRALEREYVEGMHWAGGVLSREMIADRMRLRTDLDNAAILITNLEIDDPQGLVPIMEMTLRAGTRALLIVAVKLSERAIALTLGASRDPAKFRAVAVKTPGARVDDQIAVLQDLAALTGGRPFERGAGHTLRDVSADDLGYARRVWADSRFFGVFGGKGDPRALRAHIAALREAHRHAEDSEQRKAIQQRIGKLMGGSATLLVGGATESEITARKEVAERAASVLRGAMLEGVLPGGGVALLACQPAIRRLLEQSQDEDERAACRILLAALEAPTRAILENAGCDVSAVMAEIARAGQGYGYDVRAGQLADMAQAGVFDSAAALKAAVHGAISSAALALTTDVLIHRKQTGPNFTP